MPLTNDNQVEIRVTEIPINDQYIDDQDLYIDTEKEYDKLNIKSKYSLKRYDPLANEYPVFKVIEKDSIEEFDLDIDNHIFINQEAEYILSAYYLFRKNFTKAQIFKKYGSISFGDGVHVFLSCHFMKGEKKDVYIDLHYGWEIDDKTNLENIPQKTLDNCYNYMKYRFLNTLENFLKIAKEEDLNVSINTINSSDIKLISNCIFNKYKALGEPRCYTINITKTNKVAQLL